MPMSAWCTRVFWRWEAVLWKYYRWLRLDPVDTAFRVISAIPDHRASDAHRRSGIRGIRCGWHVKAFIPPRDRGEVLRIAIDLLAVLEFCVARVVPSKNARVPTVQRAEATWSDLSM